MTPKQIARWERFRAKGKAHFVLLWGVLGWGGTTGLLMYFGPLLWNSTFEWRLFGQAAFYVDFLPQLGLWLLAGIVWGSWMWVWAERQYAEATQSIVVGRGLAPH